jgi:cytochrome c-type biogenesis protein
MLETASIGFATAFVAGVVSFLSPCVLPLVPGYVSYVAGTSLEDLRDRTASRLHAVGYAVCFVLGFSLVFVAFGASATALGGLLLEHKTELGYVSGVLILLFGLHLAGILPLHWLEREARLHLDLPGGRVVGAFLMGLAFAFGWTPCIGPILAAILAVAGSETSVWRGAALLAVYSAGLGIPFLLAALAMNPFVALLKRMRSRFAYAEKAMGALLVLTGIGFLSGWVQTASYWLLEAFPGLGRLG